MADEEEEYEVLDLSALRRNQTYIEQMLGDVTKQSAAKQVVIGGSAGCASGFLFMKVGKAAALSVGATILLVRVAQHQGYIHINWNRVNKQVNKARRTVEREAARQYPHVVQNMKRFVQQNMFLAGSFAGGFLIGMAF